MKDNVENEKITSEKIILMLKKEGVNLSPEQAKDILEFMRKLANIAITKFLRQCQK